jgi:hypothetical protein
VSHDEPAMRIESLLYDAEGRLTDDESAAVRGEVIEIDGDGAVHRLRKNGLSWEVDPKSLDGDAGELATRPHRRPAES